VSGLQPDSSVIVMTHAPININFFSTLEFCEYPPSDNRALCVGISKTVSYFVIYCQI